MIDPNKGTIYTSLAEAQQAGVMDSVAMTGTPEALQQISDAVKAQHKAKRKAQKKARRANR